MTAAAIHSGRRLAEALMTATATVYRRTGERRDGIRVVAQWSVVYTGRFRLRTHGAYESSPGMAGTGSTSTVQRNESRFPIGPYDPELGDVIRVESSRDPNLVGQLWRVAQPGATAELATAYRAPVDRLVGDDLTTFESGEVIP